MMTAVVDDFLTALSNFFCSNGFDFGILNTIGFSRPLSIFILLFGFKITVERTPSAQKERLL